MDVEKFWKQDKEKIREAFEDYELNWNRPVLWLERFIQELPDPDEPPNLEVGDIIKLKSGDNVLIYKHNIPSWNGSDFIEIWREEYPLCVADEIRDSIVYRRFMDAFKKRKIFKRIYKRGE